MNKKFLRTHRWCVVLAVVIAAVAVACLSGIPQHAYKKYTLAKFYDRLIVAEQTHDWRYLYDTSTYEQRRETTFEQYAEERDAEPHAFSLDLIVHSMRVEGDRGIVERTLVACMTEACDGDDRFEERAWKEYLFINGAWYSPRNNSVNEAGEPFETILPER